MPRVLRDVSVSWRALLVAAACAMAAPATAHAAPSIAISAPGDAVESTPVALGVSGTATSSSNHAWLGTRASRSCPADPRDPFDDGHVSGSTGSGDYSFSESDTFDNAGSYLLCAWLTDDNQNGAVVATASRLLDVRLPHLSLSIGVSPVVTRDKSFGIVATGQAEVTRFVWLDILPDGGSGCPATERAAQATLGRISVLTGVAIFGGPMTFGGLRQLAATGSYVACGYFYKDVEHGHNDEIGATPEATAQASIRVVPPCVVPHRVVGMRLVAAKTLVVQGNCRLGRTNHVRSRRYRRGRVTGASVPLGRHNSPGRLVHLMVSTGRPPARRR